MGNRSTQSERAAVADLARRIVEHDRAVGREPHGEAALAKAREIAEKSSGQRRERK